MVVFGSRFQVGSLAYFDPPIGRKNATDIPLIVLAFWGGCMLPTTFYGNQKQPLRSCRGNSPTVFVPDFVFKSEVDVV